MSEQKNNTPNLRFPAFTGEWEEKKLGEVCEVKRGVRVTRRDLKEDGKYPVFQNTDKPLGFYDFSNVKANNPFVIIGGSAGLIGFCKTDFWAADDCVTFGDSDTINKYFLYSTLLLHNMGIKNFVRGGNIPRIERVALERLQISFPSPAEQQKIASCLSAMDDLIAAQAEKVEALKEKKTGLMQQLFPQPGETTPRLRFPEFKGEWEVKNLGEVCDSILVGFPFKREDITDDASGHPILRAFSIGEGIIRHGKDYDKYYPYDAEKLKKYEVRKGDIVISMDGSVGKNIAMVSEKEERNLLIQRVARLRITNYPIHLIFQQIISQRFKDYAAGEKKGAVIAHISQKQIELFPIYVPDSPAEQEKIASCLSTLDDQIAAETEKLTALKDYKKGLMQQLFPQPAK